MKTSTKTILLLHVIILSFLIPSQVYSQSYRYMNFGFSDCNVRFGELHSDITLDEMIGLAKSAKSKGFTYHEDLKYGRLLIGDYPEGCKSPSSDSWPLFLLSDEDYSPSKPEIVFNRPSEEYTIVYQPSYDLSICINPNAPLKGGYIKVNGTEVEPSENNANWEADCAIPLEETIYLKEGINTIEVFIENSVGSTSSTYTINYEKLKKDYSPPIITLTYPNVSGGIKHEEQNKQITITGNAEDASGILEILINGQEASIDAEGNFSKTVFLAVGDNSFTIVAKDAKQNTASEQIVVERITANQDVVVVNNQSENTNSLQTGEYYALLIANNIYHDPSINSLDEPINDATRLYRVLTSEYTFKPENVTFLKNASYVQMIEAFDYLSYELSENDNLLVFYAGHGWWDEDRELGYWFPSNANGSSTAFWIRNSTISDYMGSINTKHTLLIADACFSGSIFKTRAAFSEAGQAISSLYKLQSRTAMTSGNLREVPDKSAFLEYLVKRLGENTERYLTADQLFVSFRIAVMNNSQTEPQFGTIQNAGDEGGEFIFIRK